MTTVAQLRTVNVTRNRNETRLANAQACNFLATLNTQTVSGNVTMTTVSAKQIRLNGTTGIVVPPGTYFITLAVCNTSTTTTATNLSPAVATQEIRCAGNATSGTNLHSSSCSRIFTISATTTFTLTGNTTISGSATMRSWIQFIKIS